MAQQQPLLRSKLTMSKIMIDFRLKFAVCPAITTLLLTGCMVGPKYHAPSPSATATAPPVSYKESPTQFQDTDGWKVAQPQDAMLHGKWWEIYNDPELNALEDKLNIDNQNIKQFFENFMTARTLIAEARSQLYPTVGTVPSYQASRTSSNLTNSASANTGRTSSIGSLPFDVSWAPDLWGKVRNTIHEQQYNAQLSAADLENERLTEQASLAAFFFEIRGQDALQQLLNDTVEADKKVLELARARYETGVDQRISVVEAEATLQNVQSQAINLGVARAQFEHAIAVLVGANASQFSIPVKPLLTNAPAVPVGMPSALLERRPDIAAAERRMAAANAQIGIAYAAYYPALNLSASYGYQSSNFSHFFNFPSRFWSVGPSMSETIYDGGLRRATVNQFITTYNADVATYRQTVLTAFQQVEDSLASVRLLSQQILKQQQAVTSSEEALKLEIARYETGVDPYLNVVTLQTTLLGNQETLASLHVLEMTASVQLIEALGGGWDRSQLPTPAEVSKKLDKADTTIEK
jgi:NodT family efflux transporter outer membrane factor (OMF) lipoprotein